MPGYLDQYGAGEEHRNRIILRLLVVAVAGLAIGSLSWYLFKNHHQESVVKGFVASVRAGDYQGAYRAWGCTTEKACKGYEFEKFLADWGPVKPGAPANPEGQPDPAVLGITDSESCSSGVLLTVGVNARRVEKLWVNKDSEAISFAPYPICPHKNPWAIMIHRTVGKLRKPFLN
jgi:hypothetical protein